MPIPDRIKNAPDLFLGNELYIDAFFHLNTSRNSTFDIAPITWFNIQEYCQLRGLDEETTEDMHFLIPRMDTEYISWVRSKKNGK